MAAGQFVRVHEVAQASDRDRLGTLIELPSETDRTTGSTLDGEGSVTPRIPPSSRPRLEHVDADFGAVADGN